MKLKYISILLLALVAAPALADDAPTENIPPALLSLQAYPSQIQLDSGSDAERFIVVATYADGITRDVTHEAEIKLAPDNIVKVSPEFKLLPVADGEGTLEATFGGMSASIKTIVKNSSVVPPKSFRLDIEPVLMRAGCNSGGCHGSARGKNGFRLSLFGFDPNMDYLHLTRQTKARRLTTAAPEASLMLQKATTGVAHEGGQRFEKDSPLYKTVERWIEEGAKDDEPNVAKIERVEIEPKQMVLTGTGENIEGMKHRVTVRAYYTDGTDRDVTDLAILASLNDNSADISGDGFVSAKLRGEASIIARYGTTAVVTQAIVIPPNEPYKWPDIPANNYVDEIIYKKYKQLRMLPSDICNDETFVRRAYLDILGLLPTIEETQAFLADEAPDKRAKLIDQLLERPEFPELWAMKWAELLRIESQSNRISRKAMYRYTTWLRDQIVEGVPMDKMVAELLTAKGGNFKKPSANFYLVENDPKLMAENVAQVFLGIRIQCAQCHNHPFERWTMDDYYSFSAFFSQVARKGAEDPRETIIYNSGGGEVKHLHTGETMQPRVLGAMEPTETKGGDRRIALAEWLTAADNPWFSAQFANRVWAHFMGRGIVDPPDDIRVSNPPSNPELFETLGKKFVESGYDLRALVRDICNSRTYQLSTQTNPTNEGDLTNFSRRIPKRLSAEQLLDAICQVTETPEKFSGLPLGARAVQVADGKTGNYFLDAFGRPERQSACTCDRRDEPTLSQALHLINGSTIDARLKNGEGRLARLVKEEKPLPEIVEQLYLAAYSRKPTTEELAVAEKYVTEAGDKRAGVEDLFWAVLNSKEFVFYH